MLTISALNGMEPFKFGNTFNAENKIRFLDLHFLRQVKICMFDLCEKQCTRCLLQIG